MTDDHPPGSPPEDGARSPALRADRHEAGSAAPVLQGGVRDGVDGGFVLALDGRPRERLPRLRSLFPRRRGGPRGRVGGAGRGDRPRPDAAHPPRQSRRSTAGEPDARGGRRRNRALRRLGPAVLPGRRTGAPRRHAGRAWDPVLDWAREALGARFCLSEGVFRRAAAGRGRGRARAVEAVRGSDRAGCALHHHDAHRLGPAGARGRAGRLTAERPGRPRTSTRTSRWRSGAGTTRRWSAARGGGPRWRRGPDDASWSVGRDARCAVSCRRRAAPYVGLVIRWPTPARNRRPPPWTSRKSSTPPMPPPPEAATAGPCRPTASST